MIVTISRQAASRGELVSRRTADRLALPLVNPEVVARASQRMHLHQEELTAPDRAERLGRRLAMIARDIADEPPGHPDWALTPQRTMDDPGYRRVIEAMVHELADGEGCVLAGYPGQVLLRGGGRAIHALVIAPLAVRVQRMMLREDLPAAVAERVIRESDRDRRDFYRQLYDVQWDDATLYECVLNTARLSDSEAAEVIIVAARGLYGARVAGPG